MAKHHHHPGEAGHHRKPHHVRNHRHRLHHAGAGAKHAEAERITREHARIEAHIAKLQGGWSDDINQALTKAEQAVGIPHGYLHALLHAENAHGNASAKGLSHNGRHVVSRGLLQVETKTANTLINRNREFLAAHGYPNANTGMLNDPQLNAYIGALDFKEGLQAHHGNPAQAYLYYVNPRMASGLIHAQQNGSGDMTSSQVLSQVNSTLPRNKRLPEAVANNNPSVYGPEGSWTVAHVMQNNLAKFSGVMPSTMVDEEAARAVAPVSASAAADASAPDASPVADAPTPAVSTSDATTDTAQAAPASIAPHGRHHHHGSNPLKAAAMIAPDASADALDPPVIDDPSVTPDADSTPAVAVATQTQTGIPTTTQTIAQTTMRGINAAPSF